MTSSGIYSDGGQNIDNLLIDEWSVDGSYARTTLRINNNTLAGEGWGATFKDVDATTGSRGSFIDISPTDNSPIRFVGGKIDGGNNDAPDGSVFESVKSLFWAGYTRTPFNQAVSINGVGWEDLGTSPSSEPTMAWAEGTTVRNSNSDNNEVWQRIGDGWIQIA